MNVAIVKYNAGNIYSVVNALRRMGIEPTLTDDAELLTKADKVLFPGQGHAREAMEYLRARRLDEVIRSLKQPVFGICVGQQLLCKHSEEGDVDCIGIFDAEVKRFQPERHEDKVPCMGWNRIEVRSEECGVSPLMEGLGENPYVYFVHSYYVPVCAETIGKPLDMALEFERIGYKRLHVVDLDGAKSKHIVNDAVLREITSSTNLVVDFGGGIKTDEDIEKAFAAGASMVTIGSIAVTNPDLFMGWLEQYGTDRMILGADVRHGKISINGWKEDSAEDLLPFLKKYVDAGVRNVLCTEISKDGTLTGPAIELYQEIMDAYPQLHLIASGGVSSLNDIIALNAAGIPAVVFGKAIYEGKINLKESWDWQNA